MHALPPPPRNRPLTLSGTLLLSLAFAGCGSDAAPIPEGCNVYAWEPDVGDISSFPTSDFLVPSDTTVTGFQAQFPEGADLEQYGPLGPLFRDQVVDLDGVGIQSELWLGFSASFDPELLPLSDGSVHATDGIGILVLPAEGPARLVPTETRTSTDTRTSTSFLYVRPLTPLPEATRIASLRAAT